MSNAELLDKAMMEHLKLLKTIDAKNALIANLSEQPKIAREAVDRFCAPNLRKVAYKWLESKGL